VSKPRCHRSRRTPHHGRAEAGYATLAVLFLGVAAFLALAVAVQASYYWHDWNKRFQEELKERALQSAVIGTDMSGQSTRKGTDQ